MSKYFRLDGKTPVPCGTIEWAKWFETADRKVAEDLIADNRISTVFLGLDHATYYGPPMLFETMVFDGKHHGYCDRCSTWDEAEQQHKEVCEMVRKSVK